MPPASTARYLRVALLATLVVALAPLVACGGEITNGTPEPGGPSQPGQPGQPGQPNQPGNPDAPGTPGSTCGGQDIPIKLVQKGEIPDLHLVVDRSSSMILPVDLFNLALGSKWDVMRNALGGLVDSYANNIRFGLSLYPTAADTCGPGSIDVRMGLGNGAAVKAALGQGPAGNTPTHTTLDAVRAYLASTPPGPGQRFVLLATDGMPNCLGQANTDSSAATLAAVKAIAATGTKVFVLGFGSIVAANPALLDQLAKAGGVPNPNGPNAFYPATNKKELENALVAIAGGIIPPPCTYSLNAPPPDSDKVTVSFDGSPIPRTLSNKSGWNYTQGGREITFFGAACTQLRSGKVKSVKVAYGCKGPVIQ